MTSTIILVLVILITYHLFVFAPNRILQQDVDLMSIKRAIQQLSTPEVQQMVYHVQQKPTEQEWNEQINRNMPNNNMIMASGGLPMVSYMDTDLGGEGDDILAKHVAHNQKKSKQSLDNRSLWNKNSLIPYLEEELEEHANSRWWDDDNLESRFVYQTDNIY